MQTPSIESLLSRNLQNEGYPTFAKRLHDVPVLGAYIRAWVRARSADEPRAQWASLPPVVA